ncbi:hypothetical protein BJ875DRAFT_371599 [Amylocarpus encephaloides]|uniref:Mg2+ transporter protein, CorA-like/Zinc transport protein ZntB n=1 Tax=Amylocarpus encephaloides TaxID=45428 RepID=A0A9P8C7T4_9HELO|nr:hypothetical protein BJ875DRAFT_371599 [Amylocarpus encephaloides]
MDDYMFQVNVNSCHSVVEETKSLEIFSYSDPTRNTVEEYKLTDDDFDNYLHQKGAFAPPLLPEGVTRTASMRLILQKDAKHPDTFSPQHISFTSQQYKSMIEVLNLPYRSIESTTCVGPFFWAAWDQNEEDPHLQIIMRKSDVRKKGKTRGWELTLSHSINSAVTAGFCKGTPSSDIVECIAHLKACVLQIGHPLLLPTIIFSHDVSFKNDIKQREARDWLRYIEHAVSMRTEIQDKEQHYVDKNGVVDLDAVNIDLVECHSQVLWKRPKAYLEILGGLEASMRKFWKKLPKGRKDVKKMRQLHNSMLARLDFYRVKLQGIDSYAYTTLQRLDIQRSALYNIIAQKESKLSFKMAGEQRRLAHASKRDSAAMKTISLLGAIFLPGAYLAAVFSMTFFNWNPNSPTSNSDEPDPVVSKSFWIYWAFTVPITIAVVGGWWVYERKRTRVELKEDGVEEGKWGDEMERGIMAMMRKRTLSKVSTWEGTRSPTSPVGKGVGFSNLNVVTSGLGHGGGGGPVGNGSGSGSGSRKGGKDGMVESFEMKGAGKAKRDGNMV